MQCNKGLMAATILATPHFVRLNVPELGFGDCLDALVQFYLQRGEELRTGCSTGAEYGDAMIYFCFRDPKNAEDFAERFRGEILEPALIPPYDRIADIDL